MSVKLCCSPPSMLSGAKAAGKLLWQVCLLLHHQISTPKQIRTWTGPPFRDGFRLSVPDSLCLEWQRLTAYLGFLLRWSFSRRDFHRDVPERQTDRRDIRAEVRDVIQSVHYRCQSRKDRDLFSPRNRISTRYILANVKQTRQWLLCKQC